MKKIITDDALSFDDIILEPQYSEIKSRSDVDLRMCLLSHDKKTKYFFNLPIISSPMDTVTEEEMVFQMWKNGGLGIIHRYCTIDEQVEMVLDSYRKYQENTPTEIHQGFVVGASIGVTGDYLERAKELIDSGVQILCIDIAHGHHLLMKNAIKELEKIIPPHIHIMAGNVATFNGFKDLCEWGADSIRVGISSGAACSTAINTGHGLPTLQSIIECERYKFMSNNHFDVAIIADGGIKRPGDIVKAIAAGADFCILGSMLAGTKCSPGDIINTEGKWMKNYRGSASFEAQKARGQKTPRVEGVSALVPYKGKIENVLSLIKDGLNSGCSYSGVDKLADLKYKAICRKVTISGFHQGIPHILSK